MLAQQVQSPSGLASEEDKARAREQAEANAKTACLCVIRNPGKRAQVIYDGIYNSAPIHFAPGEQKEGVRIAEHMVARLQEDETMTDDPENPNLKVIDWVAAPPEAPPVARAPRKPRPTRAMAAAGT